MVSNAAFLLVGIAHSPFGWRSPDRLLDDSRRIVSWTAPREQRAFVLARVRAGDLDTSRKAFLEAVPERATRTSSAAVSRDDRRGSRNSPTESGALRQYSACVVCRNRFAGSCVRA